MAKAPAGGPSEAAKKESDVMSFDGELFLLDDTPARPIYYPGVVFEGYRDEPWLTAQFEVGPNGRFRVTLLEGTGDPTLDAFALETLRQWRWKPRTEGRRPVASTVIKRLKAHARPRP